MPTVLVAGFGPWGPHRINPSWEWWRDAEETPAPGWRLAKAELPVDWDAAWPALTTAIGEAQDLRAVICCGLAAQRTAITPERFAHNLASLTESDVRESRRAEATIDPGGPVAYACTLPVPDLVKALAAAALPAAESRDAGDYLCNFITYRLLAFLAHRPEVRAGFIHVPPLEQLTATQWNGARECVLRTVLAAAGSPATTPQASPNS